MRLDVDVRLRPDVVADAHYLPFRDKVIGEIYCSHLLEHLQRPRLALQEIVRVLRRKCQATIIVPNIRFPWTIYFMYKYGSKRCPFEVHKWKITARALNKLLNDSGFIASKPLPLDDDEKHWGVEWILYATKFEFLTKFIVFASIKIRLLDKILGTLNRRFYKCPDNPPELKLRAIKIY